MKAVLLYDLIDKYTMENLAVYKQKKVNNVTTGDLKLNTEADLTVNKKELRKMYKPIIDWQKAMLNKKVIYYYI